MPALVADTTLPASVQAFLMTIQWAEGTARYANPYQTLFGGGQFQSNAAHPNIPVTKGGYTSTAAGAYQILKRTADGLYMFDFSPQSQDRAAVELIRRRGGYEALVAGDIKGAIAKVNKEWASFPGAGYGQPEKKLADMLNYYNSSLSKISTIATSGGTSDGDRTTWERKAIVVVAIVLIVAAVFILKK